MKTVTHEDFGREQEIRGSSDRQFGVVFTLFFLAVGLWPLKSHMPIRTWALIVSATFLLVTLVRPVWLHPLNRLWMQLGLLLGRIVNPIVTGLLFFLVFAPVGVVLRLLGRDLLRLRPRPEASTYWIPRQPPGPPPETMVNQY